MKLGQNSAFGLLGFLQSLQQGQEQQNQRREQLLQQKQQDFEQERQFGLQKQQADIAKAAADRAAEEAEFARSERDRLAPVRKLETATALGVPVRDATALVTKFKNQRTDIDGKIAELTGKLLSTRDPAARQALGALITQFQRSKADLSGSLQSELKAVAGLPDVNPYLQQFGGTVDPNQKQGGDISVDGIVNLPLPPLTKDDRDAIRAAGEKYNLGALATPYFALPSLSTRTQTATDVFGNAVNYKVGDIVNPAGGIDYNKFVSENMIPIQAMIQAQIGAGKSVFASPKEVLKDQFGEDERLWPVDVDDKGNVIPKTGKDGKSWLQGLSPVERQRVIAGIRPFINIDEATQRGIDLRHATALKAIEAQREDFEARRAQIFKNAEIKYEAAHKGTSGTNLSTAPEFLIARDTYRETLGEVSDGVAGDEVMGKALAKAPAPDELANLFGGDPNAINVPPRILAAFFNNRASVSRSLLASQRATIAGTPQEIAAKTFALGQVRNIASAKAKQDLKKYVNNLPDYKEGKNAEQYKSIMAWINSQ